MWTSIVPVQYRWVAVALLGLALYLFGYLRGESVVQAEWDAANAKAYSAEMQRFKSLQGRTDETVNQLQKDRTDIANRLQSALISLRNRSNRMPEAARANIKGTTGAELSREDAEFLTREAARADGLQAALKACYKYVDDLQK